MSTIPTQDQVREALGRVIDPEIRQPITDLGMVESIDVSPEGVVTVSVLLTVAGWTRSRPTPARRSARWRALPTCRCAWES